MGKAAVLLVIVSALAVSHATVSREENEFNANITDSDYQEQVLSREMAESALNVVVGKVKRQYLATNKLKSVKVEMADKIYRDRFYDMTAKDGKSGKIDVYSKGAVGINEYEINAVISRAYGDNLSPLTFDGEDEALTLKADSNVYISGIDRKTDGNQKFLGSPGDGVDVNGVSVRSETSFDKIWNDANSSQIEGRNGMGDVVQRDPGTALTDIVTEVTAYAVAKETLFDKPVIIDQKEPLGSRKDPAIVVVNGDFTMKSQSQAYGLVVVNGNVRLEAGARFEGMIVMMGDTRDFWMAGNVELYGGVGIHNTAPITETITKGKQNMGKPTKALPVSTSTIRMAGGARIQYSSEALMRLGDYIPLLDIDNNWEFKVERISEGHARKYGLTTVQHDRSKLDIYNRYLESTEQK